MLPLPAPVPVPHLALARATLPSVDAMVAPTELSRSLATAATATPSFARDTACLKLMPAPTFSTVATSRRPRMPSGCSATSASLPRFNKQPPVAGSSSLWMNQGRA